MKSLLDQKIAGHPMISQLTTSLGAIARISKRVPLAAVFTLVLPLVAARGQSPTIDEFTPRGGCVGEELELQLSGERLDEVAEVLLPSPDIRAVAYRAEGPTRATLKLAIDRDCPLGEHRFWLVGSRGASQLLTLRVNRFPVVDEREPNDQPAEALRIDLASDTSGVTIEGKLENADIDCYSIELAEGDRLSVEVEAIRLGGVFLDAAIDVIDFNGRQIAFSDNSPLTKQDPHLSFKAPSGGQFVVRVREAAFDGEYGARYRMHIGNFPRPLFAFPPGFQTGTTDTKLSLWGDAIGPFDCRTETLRNEQGIVSFYPSDAKGNLAASPIRLRATTHRNYIETEPNDEFAHANVSGKASVAINGRLAGPSDEDWFAFELPPQKLTELQVFAAQLGSPVDSVLEVYDSTGELRARNDDGVGHDSTLRLRTDETGSYRIRIFDKLRRGGDDCFYRIEVNAFEPQLELAVSTNKAMERRESSVITVPRGGRSAFLVTARRQGVVGPVEIDLANLPPGVSALPIPVAANSHLSTVLLEADDTAGLGATLSALNGTASAEGLKVEGRLQQRVGLTFGEPRQTIYHSTTLDEIPVVVTDPLPFSISIPATRYFAIVDGRLDLPLELSRAEGFAEAVKVEGLILPSWIETAADETLVDSDDASGTLALYPRERIAPGEYSIILIGTALIDGQPVQAATERVKIAVEEPYVSAKSERAITEQGTAVELHCELSWLRDFDGPIIATLQGLPPDTSAESVAVAAGDSAVKFNVQVGRDTPAGIHNTLSIAFDFSRQPAHVIQYAARGGTIEVLGAGDEPQQQLSRLEELRRAADTATPPSPLR